MVDFAVPRCSDPDEWLAFAIVAGRDSDFSIREALFELVRLGCFGVGPESIEPLIEIMLRVRRGEGRGRRIPPRHEKKAREMVAKVKKLLQLKRENESCPIAS